MIVLSKEQIEEMVDPDQMMDQIEEAYRIYGSGEFYMPPRPTVSTAPNTMPSLGSSGLIFGSFTAKIPQSNAPSARISPDREMILRDILHR